MAASRLSVIGMRKEGTEGSVRLRRIVTLPSSRSWKPVTADNVGRGWGSGGRCEVSARESRHPAAWRWWTRSVCCFSLARSVTLSWDVKPSSSRCTTTPVCREERAGVDRQVRDSVSRGIRGLDEHRPWKMSKSGRILTRMAAGVWGRTHAGMRVEATPCGRAWALVASMMVKWLPRLEWILTVRWMCCKATL